MDSVLRKLSISIIILLEFAIIASIGSRVSSNDYIEYWSAGRLFDLGANPYSGASILALEKSHGFLPDAPLIMLNPPWALLLVAPLGLCPSWIGLLAWIALGAGCIMISLAVLGISPHYRAVAFLFTPVIAGFSMEQSSPFLLLGFSLFLRLYRSRPFAAGAALFLLTIKPHLFLVFWIILLGDCIFRKSFSILAGLGAALATVSGFVTLIVPHIWRDYVALIRGSSLEQTNFPTLPTLFRSLIDVKAVWLALLPSLLAILWGICYYWTRRRHWDWRSHGMPVMLVTVLTSPYGWVSDEVVLLPAVASGVGAFSRRFSMEILIAVNFGALIFFCINSRILAWLPLAWLAWYLYAVGTKSGSSSMMGLPGPPTTRDTA